MLILTCCAKRLWPALLLLLAACATTPSLTAPEGKDVSLVFGHIDMSEAPSDLHWVTMQRLRPVTETPYYSFWVVDGTFFRINVPAGTYKFTKFGGHSGWKNTSYTYGFPSQGQSKLDRRIDRPGLYYAGSWKYRKVKTGFFQPGKFDVEASRTPSELELLQKMLPYADHPHWKQMIEQRIRELKK